MTLALGRETNFLGMVDRQKGLVDRRLFSDEDIYQVELERIFARAWNFMAHETQIPNPGDFFLSYIGEDRIIVVRDNDGLPQVLVNTCRHRGNAVCRAEEGHASSFMCTYHGWTYDLKGKLVGVPGFKEVYHEELDRENWGLIKAAKVDSYKGFIFATMDPEAPELLDYLGDVGRFGIDTITSHGSIILSQGIQKWTIECNWKFAADNVWDNYHAALTHASAMMSGWTGAGPKVVGNRFLHRQTVMLGEHGHAFGGGSGHPHIFPNLWIMPRMSQVSLRIPKSPTRTEIWWFGYTYEEDSTNDRREMLLRSVRHNGPGGLFEIDDGENWGESTKGTQGKVIKRNPLNYSMGLRRGEIVKDETGPAHIDAIVNEHPQLWYYSCWSEWMSAPDWPSLMKSHSPAPRGFV